MQQALEALEWWETGFGEEQEPFPIITALRERLAQPEPKHDDPIGDAQDKLIAEQAARPCKVRGPCVPTQTGPCACKELPPPIGPVVEQPQMQPCAGRNCGSTNPNLHSAECFEDYEKATGMRAWQGLTDEEKAELDAEYGDNTLAHLDAIEAKLREKNA